MPRSDLGSHRSPLYLTLLDNVSKHSQQTTKADGIVKLIFASVLMVNEKAVIYRFLMDC